MRNYAKFWSENLKVDVHLGDLDICERLILKRIVKKYVLKYGTGFESRVSSVSIVTDYGLDDRGSIPDRGRGFSF
jgi:hypothetical protein